MKSSTGQKPLAQNVQPLPWDESAVARNSRSRILYNYHQLVCIDGVLIWSKKNADPCSFSFFGAVELESRTVNLAACLDLDMPFVLLIPWWPKAKTLCSCATPLNRFAARRCFPHRHFFYFLPFFFPSDVEGCIAAAGQSREGGHVPGGRARFLATGQRKRGVCACVPHACPISRYPRALSVVSSSKLHALAPFALSCCCMTVELYI